MKKILLVIGFAAFVAATGFASPVLKTSSPYTVKAGEKVMKPVNPELTGLRNNSISESALVTPITNRDNEDMVTYHQRMGRKVNVLADEPNYNLTVTFPMWDGFTSFRSLFLVNDEYFIDTSSSGLRPGEFATSMQLGIPQGTYLVIAQFDNDVEDEDTQVEPIYRFVIRENVVVGDDTTIDFDPYEASNLISFRSTCPDGLPVVLPKLVPSEDGEESVVDYEGATVTMIAYTNPIIHKEYGPVLKITGQAVFNRPNGLSSEGNYDYFVNEVGDNIWFCQERMMSRIDWDKNRVGYAFNTFTGTQGCNSEYTLVENETSDYVSFKGKIEHTPANMPQDEKANGFNSGTTFTVLLNGQSLGGYEIYLVDNNPESYVCLQPDMKDEFFEPIMRITASAIDYDYRHYFEIPGYGTFYNDSEIGVHGYPYVHVNGEWAQSYYGNCYATYTMQMLPYINETAPEYPGNPSLYHLASQYLGEPTNNAPFLFLNFQVQPYEDGIERFSADFYYTGTDGEERNVDAMYTTCQVYRDEELVLDGLMEDLTFFEEDAIYDNHEKTQLTYVLDNRNIEVDGIPGYNKSTTILDENAEVHTFPTVQQVRFLDPDGNITNKFDAAESATLQIYGGDYEFMQTDDPWAFWMDIYPLDAFDINVYYSPYMADEWVKLDITEMPDKFYMPAYGYCWEANLGVVDVESENGWYDIRIDMTDKNGATFNQSFGPCFHLNEVSGVQKTMANGFKLRVEGNKAIVDGASDVDFYLYSTDGRMMKSGKSLDEIPSGIWIIKAESADGNAVRKVVIK